MSELTAEKLRELLSYDPATGEFRWLIVKNNRIKAGDVAGTPTGNGYRQIGVSGELFLSHRLAWLYVYGRWPENCIDHANGIRDDNRIENLREATHAENMQNIRRVPANKKSGAPLGASFSARDKRWQAHIKVENKSKSLGYFDTAEEAHAAYLKAKAELHPFQTIAEAIP